MLSAFKNPKTKVNRYKYTKVSSLSQQLNNADIFFSNYLLTEPIVPNQICHSVIWIQRNNILENEELLVDRK
jgi:hypothetical protein